MRKLGVYIKKCMWVLLLVGASVSFMPTTTQAQSDGGRGGPTCFVVDDSAVTLHYNPCDFNVMQAMGFNMDGVPNPITGCWDWERGATNVKAERKDCALSRDFSIEVTEPNCFNATTDGAYTKVDCSSFEASYDGELNDGACYTGRENGTRYIVSPAECSDIRSAKEEARDAADNGPKLSNTDAYGDTCGEGEGREVRIRFNIGCRGKGNPIIDLLFAFIRFLSLGVGLVIVGSIVVAGLQYTASAGDPNATAASIKRIENTLIAFLIYLLTYAILNWLIPAGIFN